MKKISSLAKTIDDDIVKEGLCAVGTLDDSQATKGLYFLVGGVAAQSYLPSSCRRPTSDLDLAILRPLNYEDFRGFSQNPVVYLRDNGYSVNLKKASRAFYLEVQNSKGDTTIIEFSRRNQKSFDGVAERLGREFSHSRKKLVEERSSTYAVASSEDIAIPKLARSVNSFLRNPLFERDVSHRRALSDAEVKKQLRGIEKLREEAMLNLGDIRTAEELRFVSDIYDIRVLSELSGFNESYLNEAANDWNSLTNPSFERDLLVRHALPNLKIGKTYNKL